LDGGGHEELPDTAASTRLVWSKSSYSACNGNCVEVAELHPGLIGVRDTKDAGCGPVLAFGADAWQSFINDVKKGT